MIVDICRDIKEFYKLWEECDNERVAFPEDILCRLGKDYYRCFYDEIKPINSNDEIKRGKLIGCIYFEDENGKLMLSGFGRRKAYRQIVAAVKYELSLNEDKDIYSRTNKLNARYVLRAAGFKKIDDELYVRKAVA